MWKARKKMATKQKVYLSYEVELFWNSYRFETKTMAPSEAKAKQNGIAQLAKKSNIAIQVAAAHFKNNPDSCKVKLSA